MFSGRSEILNAEGLVLRVVLRADVKGALDAVMEYINKLPSDKITVQVLRAGVGPINEADIELASMLDGQIFAFNVAPTNSLSNLGNFA